MSSVTFTLDGQTRTYSLTYDANGNLTTTQKTQDAADKTIYTWDGDDRLTGITQPNLTASYSYDAFGRRIQATVTKQSQAATTVQYLYEGSQALGEIREGKLTHRLLTGLSLDESIARVPARPSSKPAVPDRRPQQRDRATQ